MQVGIYLVQCYQKDCLVYRYNKLLVTVQQPHKNESDEQSIWWTELHTPDNNTAYYQ